MTYRKLNGDERRVLLNNDCSATDWDRIQVAEGFDANRVDRVEFVGSIRIGKLAGHVQLDGIDKPAGVRSATIVNCTLGDNVRVCNVRVHLANYDVADGVCIEDVGTMATTPGATFGNGVEVDVLNESGGREVTLFNELSAQFAYLQCVHRFRPAMIEKLNEMATTYAAGQLSDRGRVGRGSSICSVDEIRDVQIGEGARIRGAARLLNGTVLSEQDAGSFVGSGVQASDFIIAEGASVDGGAILKKCFIGQGCRIGQQFSVENSLFFANCEALHGEAVAIFAGPYTVTHHKSTLLIAGLFSFFNAGSGTNQSNHMYKLGPVHEGKLERGCKTGSFAYLMWPCRIGPFSIVLGKHKRRFDTADFPFSLIEAGADGNCNMVPGLNLTTVGTVRDGAKWPMRDQRLGSARRDRVSFDVLSPFTVGRMLTGSGRLNKIQQETATDVDVVKIDGVQVKRVLLRTGQKFYKVGIEMYLLEQVVAQAERALADGESCSSVFAVAEEAVYSDEWLDIGGQLMPRRRLDDLSARMAAGELSDIRAFHQALDSIDAAYAADQWAWVREHYPEVFGRDVVDAEDDMIEAADALLQVRSRYLRQVLADAQKEFSDTSGFGHDGMPADVARDFTEVRGTFEQNRFVEEVQQELVELASRIERFKSDIRQAVPAKKQVS